MASRRIRKVVVCLRKGRPGNGGVAMVLKEILREAGVKAVWTTEKGLKRAAGRGVDALVVGGGDGTMLHAAQATMGSGIPILGINLGSLGFLTSVKAEEIGYVLPKIFFGQYGVSTRSLLSAKLEGSSRAWCALNELSVAPASGSLMVRVRVKVGGEFLSEYHADGLLVASPTGSTAYSLSAGGPLVSPRARALVLTPVCAHAMAQRPVVVGEQEGVELALAPSDKGALLRADGVLVGRLTSGKVLRVTVAKPVVRLMHPAGVGFYGLARQKLGWSGSTARGGR
ncbi:MAG: NAD(+)/NADH kinase [Verrucomicrobiota bacterium]